MRLYIYIYIHIHIYTREREGAPGQPHATTGLAATPHADTWALARAQTAGGQTL